MQRLDSLYQLARYRTCLVGVLAYVFGVDLTGGEWGNRAIVGILVAFWIPVVANLHNSYTDLGEDAHNLPGRLLLVERAGIGTLRLVVRVSLAAIVLVCGWMGSAIAVVGVVGAFLLLSYSGRPIRAKARPLAGLAVFALVVTFPFLMGTLVTESWGTVRGFDDPTPAVGWLLYLFVWFVAKGMVKNVPDYAGDKAAGLRTSATIMRSSGAAARAAVVATVGVYAAFPLVVAITAAPTSMYWAALWCPVAGWHVTRLLRSDEPGHLNSVLKWDMIVSVVFLALLCVLVCQSAVGPVVVAASLLLLFAADLIGADSRAPAHLRSSHGGNS